MNIILDIIFKCASLALIPELYIYTDVPVRCTHTRQVL